MIRKTPVWARGEKHPFKLPLSIKSIEIEMMH
jgi:hypothetical protein